MTNQDKSTFLSDNLREILNIVSCIAQKAAVGRSIYRGEPRFFDKVSSNLYRQYGVGNGEGFSISAVQQEILEGARKHTSETDDIEILSELQHYGGKTNLIDFTTDYSTALFFACDGFPLEDGRVILLDKTGAMAPHIREPRNLTNRAIVQKSIFVIPPQGYIEPDDIVRVPKDLKQPLLEYLRHSHSISTETIYNDLHGFIRQQNLHREAYRELHLGITYHKEDEADLQHAIDHYTKAIALNPRLAQSYCGRGGAYLSNGDHQNAIQDLNRAIELEEDHSCAYANRGRVYLSKGEYDQAIEDFGRAIDLNQDLDNPTSSVAKYFRGTAHLHKGDYDQAIQDFDHMIDQKLPGDIPGTYHNRGAAYLSKGDLDRAVQDFSRAIKLNPDVSETYCTRGVAHVYKGEHNHAIQDFDQAIELDHEHSCAYHNRGITRLFLSQWEEARTDLDTAKSMGMDIVSAFCDDFESVSEFEKKNNIKIPGDISAMLGG